jgi:hypothetical protein
MTIKTEQIQAVLDLADEVARALADEGSWHEEIADEDLCDAGNFDNGNGLDCEHCQHRRRGQAIDALLTRWDAATGSLARSIDG